MPELRVLFGHSSAADTRAAAAELIAAVRQPEAALTLVFCSPHYDTLLLSTLLHDALSGPVLGCTTAGEISAVTGYTNGGAVAVSLASSALVAHVAMIEDLQELTPDRARTVALGLLKRRQHPDWRCFSLLFIDGMSLMEETTAAYLHTHLGCPLIGGSAGDELHFGRTFVFANGRCATNAAVLCLTETRLPFEPFQTHHIEPAGERLVITAADPATRRVMEIDGAPAAAAYAGLVGCDVSDLSPDVFSRHPVMLRLGGEFYVRSILRAEPDGSLVFYCAIDNGLVLTLGRGGDLVQNLRDQLARVEAELGPPAFVLGCDCILRRLEMQYRGVQDEVSATLAHLPFIGFSSYGEQVDGVHVNQTLTGIALGRVPLDSAAPDTTAPDATAPDATAPDTTAPGTTATALADEDTRDA